MTVTYETWAKYIYKQYIPDHAPCAVRISEKIKKNLFRVIIIMIIYYY